MALPCACNRSGHPHASPALASRMGGAGKTVTVTALACDAKVRRVFERIVYVPLGQRPVLQDLQASAHLQICDAPLDSKAATNDAQAGVALREAAAGKSLLLVLDDCWQLQHGQPFVNFLDAQTNSCAIFTTRIAGLVAGAAEVPLGLLPADEAARLLLSVAGADAAPPYSDEVYAAVEACGRCASRRPAPVARSIGTLPSASCRRGGCFTPPRALITTCSSRLPLLLAVGGGILADQVR